MLVSMSDQLRGFLRDRVVARREDADIAYRFLSAHIDSEDGEAHNYFDIRDADGAARLSYTTERALEKARLKHPALTPFDIGSHRTLARASSVAQRITGVTNGRALDVFSSAVLASLKGTPEIEVVRGADIGRLYREDAHCRCVPLGELAQSCMRYHYTDDRFALYADNAALAVLRCAGCGGVQGRALLWTDTKGRQFIDRIYASGVRAEQFVAWAASHQYTQLWHGHHGAGRVGVVTVPAPYKPYEAAPYLDSLYFWCRTCGTLSNRECVKDRHDLTVLRGTQGTNHRGWWGRCPKCKNSYTSERRQCGYERECGGCGAKSCTGCPNECVTCVGCGRVDPRGTTTCGNGCVVCTKCNYVNTKSGLGQGHGVCSSCGLQIQDDSVRRIPVHIEGPAWVGRCDDCGYRIRVSTRLHQAPSPTSGLVACNFVHHGVANPDVGHCPNCHVTIVWDTENVTPLPERRTHTATVDSGLNLTWTSTTSSATMTSYQDVYNAMYERWMERERELG